jgi:hypothetical protein
MNQTQLYSVHLTFYSILILLNSTHQIKINKSINQQQVAQQDYWTFFIFIFLKNFYFFKKRPLQVASVKTSQIDILIMWGVCRK